MIGSIPGPEGIEYEQSRTLTEWMDRTGADAVIWTALPAKSRGHNGRVPSVDEATAYLRSLHGDERTRAEAYIRQTPASIARPFGRTSKQYWAGTPRKNASEVRTLTLLAGGAQVCIYVHWRLVVLERSTRHKFVDDARLKYQAEG